MAEEAGGAGGRHESAELVPPTSPRDELGRRLWNSFTGNSFMPFYGTGTDDNENMSPRSQCFMDAEAMKAKLRQTMLKPSYDVCDFYHADGWCQMVARSNLFEKATLAVIAFNALWIAVDTDMNKSTMLINAHPIFQVAEHGFCMYFTWEWVIRFCAFRRKRDGLRDAWFIFDSGMVLMMVAETWVMSAVMLAVGASSGGLGNAGTLRLLRLLRLSRMARMAKLLRSFPELLILIKGMASAMRSVIVTLVLLFLLIYVFAIAFRQLTDSTAVGQEYFPDMWVAMHTLWIDGTLLDGPGTIAAALLQESVLLTLVFYLFVLMAALTVMNMLIGVLCEVVSAVAATEKEQITVATVKDGFTAIIGGIDTDANGTISKQEFQKILENPLAVDLFSKVDVDVYAFVDLADFLFQEEDGDQPVEMSFTKFMETILQLRGSNAATVKDVVDLRKFIKSQLGYLSEKLDRRQSVLRRSIHEVQNQTAQLSRSASIERLCLGGERAPRGRNECDLSEARPAAPFPPVVPPPQQAGSLGVGIGGHSHLWMQAAEMRGVLTAARDRLGRFLGSMPLPSAPTIESSSHTGPGGGPGQRSNLGHPDAAAGPKVHDFSSGSTWDTISHWNHKPLPGVVGGLSIPGTPRDESITCLSEDSGIGAEAGPPTRPAGGAPLPPQAAAAARLAELRVRMRQLEQAMTAGAEELRSIQELL